MYIVKCKGCWKDAKDSDKYCPHCGALMPYYGPKRNEIKYQVTPFIATEYKQPQPRPQILSDNEVCCPKCKSKQFTTNKKGFSGTKAVAGVLLVGGIGALAGTAGSNKIKMTCLSCGYTFEPGQSRKLQSEPLTNKEGIPKVIIPVILFVIVFILILYFVGFLASLAFMIVVLFIEKLILTPN